jgi:TolA-binding protein
MSISLRAEGRIENAVEILDGLTKSKSAGIASGAHVLLGIISLEDRGDLAAAERYFSDAIDKYPRVEQTAQAYRGLTEVYLREGDLAGAERTIAKRRSVAPQDPWAICGLGELAFFRGASDTAGIFFRNVVLSFPKSTEANDAVQYLALIADASESGDIEKIAAAFKDMRQDRVADALQKFDDLIEKHSSQPWADLLLWNRANIEIELDDIAGCKDDLTRIADDFPDGYHASQAVELLGDLAHDSGDLVAAAHHYNRILTDFPDAVNIERVRGKLKEIPGNI